MLILLPASAAVIYLNFWLRSRNLVRSLVNSWLLITLFVMTQAELFSVFKIWTSLTVTISWTIILLVGGAVAYHSLKNGLSTDCVDEKNILKEKVSKYRGWLLFFLFYFGIVILMALLSGQSNVDSLIYHLPRIMHWIQNKSVGHYATSVDLQIRYPVLSEYLVAQVYLFGASDRLANLVQTGAYISSAMMVYGITRRLGGSIKSSFLASWIYILMPMAMAQAYTAQTDDIAGMFLLIFIYVLLDFIQADKLGAEENITKKGIQLSASVVFGYLCKPTICFTMVVFFVWMCFVRLFKKDRLRVLLQYVAIGLITAIVLFGPLLLKSYHTYVAVDDAAVVRNEGIFATDFPINKRAYLYPDMSGHSPFICASSSALNTIAPDASNVTKAMKDPKRFLMTCLQNMGRNAASNCFPAWNDFIIKVVNKAGRVLDYDTSKFSLQTGMNFFECDTASNPVIMCLGGMAFICALFSVSRINREQKSYAVCAIISLILQCGLMGYTAFRTRYLVGILAVMCPAILIVIANLRLRERIRESIVIICVTVACFGGINTFCCELGHVRNGLSGHKLHQYFRISLRENTHVQMMKYLNDNGYTNIGVEGYFSYEYVLWKGIENLERLESVNVHVAPLKKYEDGNFLPECIVEETQEEKETVKLGKSLICHGAEYRCVWTIYGNSCHYSVYIPTEGLQHETLQQEGNSDIIE